MKTGYIRHEEHEDTIYFIPPKYVVYYDVLLKTIDSLPISTPEQEEVVTVLCNHHSDYFKKYIINPNELKHVLISVGD